MMKMVAIVVGMSVGVDCAIGMDVRVNVCVLVAFLTGTAEEPAHLMGSEEGDHFEAFVEVEGDAFDMVCLEDGHHDFTVDGKGDVDFGALDYGGPVLVADSVTEFDGDTDNIFGSATCDSAEVDNEDGTEVKAEDDGCVGVRVEGNDVAVDDMRVAFEGDGEFVSFVTLSEETAFLSGPLIEENGFDIETFELSGPLGAMRVANNFGNNFHEKKD